MKTILLFGGALFLIALLVIIIVKNFENCRYYDEIFQRYYDRDREEV
jgi:hypothetical protein